MAALSTYAGKRFGSGREIRASLTGFWTLIDKVSPAELEPPGSTRPAEYVFTWKDDGGGDKAILVPWHAGPDAAQDQAAALADGEQEREAKRLCRQMRKLAASYVFSNLDCTESGETAPPPH